MSHIHVHRCDTCGRIDSTHPDDGTPAGWWLVAQMTKPGCWDDETEHHFCSHHCLTGWAVDD